MELINVSPDLRPENAETALENVRRARRAIEKADDNINMNLLGYVGDVDLEFRDLVPTWCSRFIFWIWPALILLTTPICLFVYSQIVSSIGESGIENIVGSETAFVSPEKDFIFALRPLVLIFILLLFRVRKTVQPLMQSVYQLDAGSGGPHWNTIATRNGRWAEFIRSRWLLLLLIVVIIVGGLAPVFKNQSYWFDWRISPFIFIVNRISYGSMIIGYALSFATLIAMVDLVMSTLRGTRLNIDLFNSDRAGGLSVVGGVVSVFIPFLFAADVGLVVSVIRHSAQGEPLHMMFDWGGLLLVTAAIYFLLWYSMSPIHQQLKKQVDVELERHRRKRLDAQEKKRGFLDAQLDIGSEKADYFIKIDQLCERFERTEAQLRSSWTWPIRKRTMYMYLVLSLLPVAVSLAATVLGFQQ